MVPKTLALVGLRCSGKSTLGRHLAQALDRQLVDLDDAMLSEANSDAMEGHGEDRYESAGGILSDIGEQAFRDLETRTLERVLSSGRPLVLATGGGIIDRPANRALLREQATTVWLTCDIGTLQERMRQSPLSRPALLGSDPIAEIPELAERRAPLFREVAAFEHDSGTSSVEELTQEILASLT